MNNLTKKWCDEVSGTKEDIEASQSLKESENNKKNNENNNNNHNNKTPTAKSMNKVRYKNSAKNNSHPIQFGSNSVFESDTSDDDDNEEINLKHFYPAIRQFQREYAL